MGQAWYPASVNAAFVWPIVIMPRTKSESACLCFSLMSKAPTRKPSHRDPDASGPSRSVVLDSQDNSV